MSSKVVLPVAYEDDNSHETLVYSGETIMAPCELIKRDFQPITWKLSGTPIKFSATVMPLPDCLGLEERFQTITFMSIYTHKSIDELRFEDYQCMDVNQCYENETSSFPPCRPTPPKWRPTSPSDSHNSPSYSPTSSSYSASSSAGITSGMTQDSSSKDQCSTFGKHDWIRAGIKVQMKECMYCEDSQLTGKKGVVQRVYGEMCNVYLYEEKREVSIAVCYVRPEEVAREDKGEVIPANARSLTEILVNIDNPDGNISMDIDQVKILPLKNIAKLVSVDSSTDVTKLLPSISTFNFIFKPTINFISEANTDPTQVFSPQQPPAAANEPLSSLSVSEEQQLRDALLETIVKCMQIQNSLYRLVLLKLQAYAIAAAVKANTHFYEYPSMGSAEMNQNYVSIVERTENSTERPHNAVKASSVESLDDTPGASSMEGTVESLHDTSGISRLVDPGAILNDSHKISGVGNTEESPSDAPETLLYELIKPLQALTRCTGIQRELFQRLITVTAITSKEETVLSELHTKGKVNMLSVQSKLEAIAFKTKMECTYARNPFSNHQPKLSTSQDVVQHISSHNHRSFSVGADGGSRSLRDLPHGRGRLETVSGEVVYSGDWCKGKRHGKGECLILGLPVGNNATAEHGFYIGGWKNNMRHGSGKMIFFSGAVYEGQWQFDKMTGYGTLKLPDGTIQEGTWKEGSLQGCALFTWPHGVTEYREYHTNRAQLSFRTIEKEPAEHLSQMSSIRSQLLNLRECVTELKNEKLRLTGQQKAQKLEHDEMVCKVNKTVFEIRESYKEKWKRESQAQLKELEKAADQVAVVKKQLEEAKAGLLCQICFKQRRDCIILPCSHLLYCRKCVVEHKRKGDPRCPTCRGPINSEILCNVNH